MEGGGINLNSIISQVLSTVPVWGIVLAGIGFWLNRVKKFQEKEEKRWSSIEHRIYNMEIILASSGIADIKRDMAASKEFQVESKMNFKALWRAVDPGGSRKSD